MRSRGSGTRVRTDDPPIGDARPVLGQGFREQPVLGQERAQPVRKPERHVVLHFQHERAPERRRVPSRANRSSRRGYSVLRTLRSSVIRSDGSNPADIRLAVVTFEQDRPQRVTVEVEQELPRRGPASRQPRWLRNEAIDVARVAELRQPLERHHGPILGPDRPVPALDLEKDQPPRFVAVVSADARFGPHLEAVVLLEVALELGVVEIDVADGVESGRPGVKHGGRARRTARCAGGRASSRRSGTRNLCSWRICTRRSAAGAGRSGESRQRAGWAHLRLVFEHIPRRSHVRGAALRQMRDVSVAGRPGCPGVRRRRRFAATAARDAASNEGAA